MSRSWGTRLAALLAGGLATFAISGTAAAAPGGDVTALANCPADTLCIYQHDNFGGNVFYVSSGSAYPTLHTYACPGCDSRKHRSDGTWGDQLSSWTNNTSRAYCWYYDINYGGYVTPMAAGAAVSYVGKGPNDEASSVQPC
jgi:hypothetical protein